MSCTFDNVNCNKCDNCDVIDELDEANDQIRDLSDEKFSLELEIDGLEDKISELEYEIDEYKSSYLITSDCNSLYDENKCNILQKLYELPLNVLEGIEKAYV